MAKGGPPTPDDSGLIIRGASRRATLQEILELIDEHQRNTAGWRTVPANFTDPEDTGPSLFDRVATTPPHAPPLARPQ